MAAKSLTNEQLEDAKRLRDIFRAFKEIDPSMTQEKLAHVCGWRTQGTITQYLNGKIPLNLRAAKKFADALDAQIEDFSPGLAREVMGLAEVSTSVQSTDQRPRQPVLVRKKATAGMIEIPLYDAKALQMKGKARSGSGVSIERMALSSEWLRGIVKFTRPGNLGLLTATDDGMESTFGTGDLLLIDRGVSDVMLDAIYVLSLNSEVYIKRLQRRPDGSLLMISDNKKYPPYTIVSSDVENIKIMGRALLVWDAKKL